MVVGPAAKAGVPLSNKSDVRPPRGSKLDIRQFEIASVVDESLRESFANNEVATDFRKLMRLIEQAILEEFCRGGTDDFDYGQCCRH